MSVSIMPAEIVVQPVGAVECGGPTRENSTAPWRRSEMPYRPLVGLAADNTIQVAMPSLL
jgi:hypothetical protein